MTDWCSRWRMYAKGSAVDFCAVGVSRPLSSRVRLRLCLTVRFPVRKKSKVLRIRAGTDGNRCTGAWFVVVQGRVFVRSMDYQAGRLVRDVSARASGRDPTGKVGISVRAVLLRSKALRDAVVRACLERYST
jgi:hypothetical protein